MASIYQDKESGGWLIGNFSARKESITYAATITFVAAGSATDALNLDANINHRYVPVTGACTFAAPVSGVDQDTELHLQLLCDGTDRTMTFGTGFEARGTMAIESATTAIIAFRYNQAASKFIEMYRSFTAAS